MKTSQYLTTMCVLAAFGISACSNDASQLAGPNGSAYQKQYPTATVTPDDGAPPPPTSEPQPAPEPGSGGIIARPIGEWTAAQGTYCSDNGSGGCMLYAPPVANYGVFYDQSRSMMISVDYAGIANRWLMSQGRDFGTTTSGAINEQPIGDGRVQVTIELHTLNAISFISRGVDVMGGPVILGHRPMDLVQPQNDAGKGDVFMRIVYISMPGMPIPDLIKLIRAPEPGQKLVSFEMSYQGRGITEDGRYVEFGIKSSDPLMYSLPENAQNTPPAGYTTLDGFDG